MPKYQVRTKSEDSNRFIVPITIYTDSPAKAARRRIERLSSTADYDAGTVLVTSDYSDPEVFDWERREVPATKEIVLS